VTSNEWSYPVSPAEQEDRINMDKYGSTRLRQEALAIAKALSGTLLGRRTATAYEIADHLYVIAQGPNDLDLAYSPGDALRRAKGETSVPLVITPEVAVAYFMASGRNLADASDVAVLKPKEVVEALSLARSLGAAVAVSQ
jgi:hypothetical protein